MSRAARGGAVIPVAFLAIAWVASAADLATDAEQVVARFHAALAAGDRGLALTLLGPDAIVMENGRAESRAEYAAGHLAADMEFARQVRVERGKPRTLVEGRTAWVSSVNTIRGQFSGRPVDLINAELIVLTLNQGRWLIRAIHWSSRVP